MRCAIDGPGLAGRRRADPAAFRPRRGALATLPDMAQTPSSASEAVTTGLVPAVPAPRPVAGPSPDASAAREGTRFAHHSAAPPRTEHIARVCL